MDYSTNDGRTWSPFTVGTTIVTLANIGDEVCFRGTNSAMSGSYNSNYNYFVMSGQISASGNINSLLDGNNYQTMTTVPRYAYSRLFNNCTALVDAEHLILGGTTTSQNCFGHGMFAGCSNLVNGPEIMATSFVTYAAEYMFQNCSSLASVKIHRTESSWNQNQTQSWMSGVPGTGTFYYNGTVTTRGVSYIPEGWTITQFS